MLRSHAFATGVGGGGTGPHAANGSSMAYTLCGLAASVSFTHSTSLFLIAGCQLCDRPKVTGSHSTSPGWEVIPQVERAGGISTEVTRLPSALLI